MPRVTISVPNLTPQPYRFDLKTRTVTMGRGSDNDIVIECGSVSGRHAEMVRVDGGYELRDLASTNGIKKNGKRLDVIPLFDGDQVKLGDIGFDFQLSEDECATLAAEMPEAKAGGTVDDKAGDDEGTPRKLPPKRRDIQPPRQSPPIVVKGGGGFGMLFLFVLLAFAAFWVGLTMRHKSATGGSLVEAVQNRLNTPIEAPQPGPEPEVEAPVEGP